MRMNNQGYVHKVNKSQIPTCKIMGVNVAAINMEWLLDFTKKNLRDLSGDYMCVSNVHTTVMAYENLDYKNIQNGGIMAIPDGGPLSTVGRKRGYHQMERTTGPSYMEKCLELSTISGYSHFFYGGTEETLGKLKKVLESKYQGLNIAGMYSPPFRELSKQEEQQIISMINSSNADFVWIGLGAPKQEIWMARHQGAIHGFMVGVGAAFDYLAGNIKRAPEWMQKSNLEWLYRLMQEPKRLFKRYMYTNLVFIFHEIIIRK